ncbi:sigma-70 family RNA polymerase sigma factor [Rhodocytophaga aerolata]|uniref:Sigma-70 family RNA polymerase sigma factor n=1 Tax=Rhodocytophaga aerolata TaxID=455078 RepID=A0ABT8RC31_9BACT|nr:sigma-70 family RNA polymerase sigma factor [Rhodocytophaga aerolata]MDO1449662.1 sigma-70 family RNA polymerase sigma factor [Rhodocytophaga aerolata]
MNKMFAQYTDTQLWQAFTTGNKEALSYIYLQHYKYLINYGIRLYSKEEVVEDCIHDIFTELWQRRKSTTHLLSIRLYLLKALRNKIYSYLKKQQTSLDVNLYTDNYHFTVEYSFEENLIRELGDEELKRKLVCALNQLSARQKEAIYLRFYNNLDYEQIAMVMGISNQSIRTHVYQAIKLLREKLAVELTLVALLLKLL